MDKMDNSNISIQRHELPRLLGKQRIQQRRQLSIIHPPTEISRKPPSSASFDISMNQMANSQSQAPQPNSLVFTPTRIENPEILAAEKIFICYRRIAETKV